MGNVDTARQSAFQLAPRIIAGRYRLGALIGEGGMGSVFRAEHLGLEAEVAVKILHEGCATDPKVLARFRREARAMGVLKHKNVVQVLDAGTDEDGTPFLVMELLEGENLSAKIRRAGLLGPEVARWVGAQVLAGLSAAHGQGVVHRDLKAGNVFVARQPDGSHRVKLLDFGVSKLVGSTTYNVTAQGAVVGTPCCMAPEQLTGEVDSDPRIDIFAAGVLLYRLVTGRLPHRGTSANELFREILRGEAPRPRVLNAGVSADLEAVILKAMAPRPAERYQTALAMREALLSCGPALEATRMITPRVVAVASEADEAATEPFHHRAQPMPASGGAQTAPSRGPAPTARVESVWSRGAMPPAARTRRLRRPFLFGGIAAAVVLLLALAAGELQERVAKAADEPLRYGVVRSLPTDLVVGAHQSVADYLAERLERRVELVVLEDDHALAASLLSGELDVAALSSLSYVRARTRAPDLPLLATPVMAGGARSYEGLILARVGAGVQKLEDLRGRVFCYVSPDSTSGYHYPRAVLRRAGIDPDSAFAATRFGGDHLSTLRELDRGACDAAAVYAGVWFGAGDHGLPPERFHLLAGTDQIPLSAYAASPSLPGSVIRDIRDALLDLRPGSEMAERHLQTGLVGIAGYAPVRDKDYDRVREVAAFLDLR